MTWLSSEESWPRHPRKEAERALKEARELGWEFRPESKFGRIRCPVDDHQTCSLGIWNTPRGDKSGTATAKMIRAKLRSCEKLRVPAPEETTAGIAHEIRQVERLLDAAELLRASDALYSEAEEAFEQADDPAFGDPGGSLEEAIRFEEEAESVGNRAQVEAAQTDAADPWPPAERAQELADAAVGRLGEILQNIDADGLDVGTAAQLESIRRRLTTFGL